MNKSKKQLIDLCYCSEESIDQYYNTEKYLRGLLVDIVEANSISESQVDSLVTLYCGFDEFRGNGLLTTLFIENDNCDLVWNSFKSIAKKSPEDTCYISALINLDNCIRTNVELAEAMPSFIIDAIKINPYGFLDMISVRSEVCKSKLSEYTLYYDTPDKDLIRIFEEISSSSDNNKYQDLASELIKR